MRPHISSHWLTHQDKLKNRAKEFMKTAIITGITGQDGAYLADLLLVKGYTVYGAYRRTASTNFWRIKELGVLDNPNLHLVEYDLTDLASSIRLLKKANPDEVYNLAAQSLLKFSA